MADVSLKTIPGVFTQSDIDKLDAISADKANTEKQKSKVLDQDAFMKILAAQLKYQDPLSPMKDQEFIGQMAQFNSLDAMNNLVELTQANSKTDKDMTAIMAAMSIGIDKLVAKLAPEESTTTTSTAEDGTITSITTALDGTKTTTITKPDGTKTTTTTAAEKKDSEKLLEVSSDTLEEIKKMTAEMAKMAEAMKAYADK